METLLTPSRVQVSVNSTWQAETTSLPPRPDGICKRNFLHPRLHNDERVAARREQLGRQFYQYHSIPRQDRRPCLLRWTVPCFDLNLRIRRRFSR